MVTRDAKKIEGELTKKEISVLSSVGVGSLVGGGALAGFGVGGSAITGAVMGGAVAGSIAIPVVATIGVLKLREKLKSKRKR